MTNPDLDPQQEVPRIYPPQVTEMIGRMTTANIVPPEHADRVTEEISKMAGGSFVESLSPEDQRRLSRNAALNAEIASQNEARAARWRGDTPPGGY